MTSPLGKSPLPREEAQKRELPALSGALSSGNNSGTEMDCCSIIFLEKAKRTLPFPLVEGDTEQLLELRVLSEAKGALGEEGCVFPHFGFAFLARDAPPT